MKFVVVFDACVLYPAPLRDFLLRLATTGLFAAKWTDDIHDEWMRNLAANRPELADKLPRTRELMNTAVPDCLVTGYEPLIPSLELPDLTDRHVLVAASRSGAQIIVTFNLKDFPPSALGQFDIEAMHIQMSLFSISLTCIRGRFSKLPKLTGRLYSLRRSRPSNTSKLSPVRGCRSLSTSCESSEDSFSGNALLC